ncbi:MAG: aminotransferase [Clostridia bacterium]
MNIKNEFENEKSNYETYKAKGISLDISRGKPNKSQIDYIASVFKAAENKNDFYVKRIGIDKSDAGNYGLPNGISELRNLFSDILDVPVNNIIIGGNSSLSLMYDLIVINLLFGNPQSRRPWKDEVKIKFLCPCPGYDRHFAMIKNFGFEMIPVPMTPNGPDMDIIEKLVSEDDSIRGIWCVPIYSNPEGYVYSYETVMRLAKMTCSAPDFRIFWDNAYFAHHLDPNRINTIPDILKLCADHGNEDRVYEFASTSKISFPGAGIAVIASSKKNIAQIQDQFKYKTIGNDKMNMWRHSLVFKTKADVYAHMAKLSEFNRPKFKATNDILESELKDYGRYVHFTHPEGGYFLSFNTMKGCAKRTYALCKAAGLIITTVGDTYPNSFDPDDSNIRIAPTYAEMDDLVQAMHLFACCVKLAILEKLNL